MNWSDVGSWVEKNAGAGASLVGSLMVGNLPGAVAAGVSLVSSATGTNDPLIALQSLQNDPATVVKLRELANANEADIRAHIAKMHEADLADAQAEQEETGKTVRNGDNAEDRFVRWTRPGESWVSLFAALAYVFTAKVIDGNVLALLLALPWGYAGLRQIGKGIDAFKK